MGFKISPINLVKHKFLFSSLVSVQKKKLKKLLFCIIKLRKLVMEIIQKHHIPKLPLPLFLWILMFVYGSCLFVYEYIRIKHCTIGIY